MARVQRTKAARQSTAAYAASQPLFDALRNGCARIDEQSSNLTLARDTVQRLHVHMPIPTSELDVDKHDEYIRALVTAWKSATDIYADVFDALANVTAADMSTGRAATDAHDIFVAMAEIAKSAMGLATTYLRTKQTPGTTQAAKQAKEKIRDDDNEEDRKAGRNESNTAGAVPTDPTVLALLGKRSRLADTTSYEQPANKIQKTSNTTIKDTSTSETKTGRAQHDHEGKAATGTRKISKQASVKLAQFDPTSLHKDSEVVRPQVEFEDISAEVEARLRSKEEKRGAKKHQKKRKRESAGSTREHTDVSLPVETHDVELSKPRIKKIRTGGRNNMETGPLEPASEEKKAKRKNDTEAPKKRKKVKM